MSLEFIRAELARYTYKPGWTLTARENTAAPFLRSAATLDIMATVQDSRNPGRYIKFDAHYPVSPYIDTPELFRGWLTVVLMEVERHEMREWLRYDGELVDDPHAEAPH